jgi:hypothetical protein
LDDIAIVVNRLEHHVLAIAKALMEAEQVQRHEAYRTDP